MLRFAPGWKAPIKFLRSVLWRSRSATAPKLPKFATVLGAGKGKIPKIHQYDVKLKRAAWIRNVVVRSSFFTRLKFLEAASIETVNIFSQVCRPQAGNKTKTKHCKSPPFVGKKVFRSWSCLSQKLIVMKRVSFTHYTLRMLLSYNDFLRNTF